MPLLHPPAESISLPSDEELLRRSAAGDREAFEHLVRAHQHRVVQLAMRLLGSLDQAEDVAQEAFLRVYKSASTFQPRAKFSTWLYRVVVNLCHDQRRKWKWRPMRIADDPPAPIHRSHIEQDEISARVHATIDQLPQRQRTVLILHRFENLSYHDIAQSTGFSESAVESLLMRAYANLRQSLKDLK